MSLAYRFNAVMERLTALASAVAFAACLSFCLVGEPANAMTAGAVSILTGLMAILRHEMAKPRHWTGA